MPFLTLSPENKQKLRELAALVPGVAVALGKTETPLKARLIGGLIVVYALSPVDLIPDFIPVLGYLDDLLVLPLLMGWMVRSIPAELLAACVEEARTRWPGGPAKNWRYALPFVGIWTVVLVLLGLLIF